MISNRKKLSLQLEIDVEGTTHVVDFDDMITRLKVDKANIDEEAAEQPALYAWIGVLAEEASYEMATAKRALELGRSALLKDLRTNPPKYLRTDGKRQPAQATFEAEVESNEAIQQLADEYQSALRTANLMAIAKESARSRAGLIRELASKQRGEYGAGV